MRIFIGFDDTDTINAPYGTGKLARWFGQNLPDGCRMWGTVRQQLLVDNRIPFTSHNSAACVVIDAAEPSLAENLITNAIAHIEKYSSDGSDPGLCIACENGIKPSKLVEFGLACTREIMSQKDALHAASGIHLSAHGGTNDGIIGAAAAVGLTMSGWCGRFIEFGELRNFPDTVQVSELEAQNIRVISIDRDGSIPAADDMVLTHNWIRPRLLGNQAILMVRPKAQNIWENIGEKRRLQTTSPHDDDIS